MNTISMATAGLIWSAHSEIEKAQKMLADLKDKKQWEQDPNPIDPFGRQRPYTFGVPHGDNGHRLIDVSPNLAVHVLEAHIVAKQRDLVEACARASLELQGAFNTEAAQ